MNISIYHKFYYCIIAVRSAEPRRSFPYIQDSLGIREIQVGTTIMYVDYAMNADTIGQEGNYIDLQRLEVGNECSKYSSLFLKRNVERTRVVEPNIAKGK